MARATTKSRHILLDFKIYTLILLLLMIPGTIAWTGEIRGRIVCDVCGDSSIGPEDHVLEGIAFKSSFSFSFLGCFV